MKTLKLFNTVIAKESDTEPFISDNGFIIEPNAMWAKDRIIEYYAKEKLSGNDLNKTFHKSWSVIKNSTRFELFIEQIKHYISTYGTNFQGEIYMPDEIVELPDNMKLKYKVIKGYSKDEMKKKCLNMLKSGMALKEETIDDLISILSDELDYIFTGKEDIRNKEAIVKIAENYGVFPDNPAEFFRYIIYRTTGQTLLIKNNDLISQIKTSSYNPSDQFKKFGLERLAEIFNRFKPLFLAYKTKCPKTINKISKLSKDCHKPMKDSVLNQVTSVKLKDGFEKDLYKATPYALFKALATCYVRKEGQDSFLYRIRNGKSWATENPASEKSIVKYNFDKLLEYAKSRFDLTGKKFFFPKGVKFALPTTEKMYVGNIPTGTRFSGKKLAVGVYWENKWGANDLDISGLNIGGKIGWNSDYKQGNGYLMYSGDITSAPKGAVEYMYAKEGLSEPTLIMNNVFNGKNDTEYKIIIGKGDKVSRDYMMNPENLFMEAKCQSVQKQTILGIFIPNEEKQNFVLLNFGAGSAKVSGNSKKTDVATKALFQQWSKLYTFNKFVKELGAEICETNEEVDFDFSLENLEKDSFLKVFEKSE